MNRYEEVELTNMCMVKTNDPEPRYLVIDRKEEHWPGIVFPGGHVEREEPVTKSIIREVLEETGISIINPSICGLKQFKNAEGRRYIVFLFYASEFKGDIQSSSEGEAKWMTMKEIEASKTVNGFYEMLRVFEDKNLNELYYSPNINDEVRYF